jgi:predicted Zn-dependent protease
MWGDPWTTNVVSHVIGLQLMRKKIKQAMRSGELVSARKLIQEYFTYEPDNVLVRRFDAMCDVRQGSVNKGLQKLITLIQEDPNDTFSMMLLAKSRLNIPQLRNKVGLEVTKEILETVLAIDTENGQAKILLDDIAKMLTPKDEE